MKEGKSQKNIYKLTLRNERIVGYMAISVQTGVMMVMLSSSPIASSPGCNTLLHRVFNNVHLVMLWLLSGSAHLSIVHILAAAQLLLHSPGRI